MTTQVEPIKSRHRAMWASGDYNRVAVEVVGGLGPILVEAAGVRLGDRVLDVAAGSGNASLPAAAAGATVVATDLTPELVEQGRARSAAAGLRIEWGVADAEHLGLPSDEYDVTMSCIGVMFAPFHQPVADELVRVTKPGGRIALANWTPAGFVGQLFATMKPFAAPPPEGASPGPLWGDADHVRSLLGDRVTGFRAEKRLLPVDAFASAVEFREFFARNYGPTLAAYRNNADDADRVAALDGLLDGLARSHGADTGRMEWEYLLVTAEVV